MKTVISSHYVGNFSTFVNAYNKIKLQLEEFANKFGLERRISAKMSLRVWNDSF